MQFDTVLEYLMKLEELANSTASVAAEAQELMTRRMSEHNMKLIMKLVDKYY